MTTKPAFPALDAPTVTGFDARGPVSYESVLPKSAKSGNLSLNKVVIRWMSGKRYFFRRNGNRVKKAKSELGEWRCTPFERRETFSLSFC
jgi:hypothetical protein